MIRKYIARLRDVWREGIEYQAQRDEGDRLLRERHLRENENVKTIRLRSCSLIPYEAREVTS